VVSLMCVGEGRIFSIFSPANTLAGDYSMVQVVQKR
jgi:hypothetical protein